MQGIPIRLRESAGNNTRGSRMGRNQNSRTMIFCPSAKIGISFDHVFSTKLIDRGRLFSTITCRQNGRLLTGNLAIQADSGKNLLD